MQNNSNREEINPAIHFCSLPIACNCTEHGTCNEGREGTGSCFCDKGWTGPQCGHKLGM